MKYTGILYIYEIQTFRSVSTKSVAVILSYHYTIAGLDDMEKLKIFDLIGTGTPDPLGLGPGSVQCLALINTVMNP
jgi:2-keto-4-pentenoate hydratase/2-oxohepta-3-ene-1,7-dioic acid hydratase in catechol pathway